MFVYYWGFFHDSTEMCLFKKERIMIGKVKGEKCILVCLNLPNT